MLALLLACADPVDDDKDTGLPADTGEDAAESGESADSAAETALDSGDDSAAETGDTAADSAVDTAADSADSGPDDTAATCADATCVPYGCWCGECEESDIQCVTQAWADANPCMLGCPIAECPELTTTRCECDEATGVCVKS